MSGSLRFEGRFPEIADRKTSQKLKGDKTQFRNACSSCRTNGGICRRQRELLQKWKHLSKIIPLNDHCHQVTKQYKERSFLFNWPFRTINTGKDRPSSNQPKREVSVTRKNRPHCRIKKKMKSDEWNRALQWQNGRPILLAIKFPRKPVNPPETCKTTYVFI